MGIEFTRVRSTLGPSQQRFMSAGEATVVVTVPPETRDVPSNKAIDCHPSGHAFIPLTTLLAVGNCSGFFKGGSVNTEPLPNPAISAIYAVRNLLVSLGVFSSSTRRAFRCDPLRPAIVA